MRRVDSLRRWLRPLLAALLAAGTVLPARAWNDHALLTWLALQPMVAETAGQPAARAALRERVRAESLEAFVAAEAPRLEPCLPSTRLGRVRIFRLMTHGLTTSRSAQATLQSAAPMH